MATFLIKLGRDRDFEYLRHLSPAECDLLGYEGPLDLSACTVRYLFGRRRRTGAFVAVHRRNGIVWRGTRKELERLGVALE